MISVNMKNTSGASSGGEDKRLILNRFESNMFK